MSNKITTESFITKAKEKYKDKFTYELTEYKSYKTKVVITCNIHGNFQISPNNFLDVSKYGCVKCGNELKGLHHKLSLNDFISKANSIHNNKYSYANTEYINSHSLITITCPEHGDFSQKAYVHLQNHGCPECAKTSNSISKRLSVNQNYPVWLYYIYIPELRLWKIGCTKDINKRFKAFPYKYDLIYSEMFTRSIDAYFIEGWILKATYANKTTDYTFKGFTELRTKEIDIKSLIIEAKGTLYAK